MYGTTRLQTLVGFTDGESEMQRCTGLCRFAVNMLLSWHNLSNGPTFSNTTDSAQKF